MKIGFLITARMKSTRLPRKLTLKINDREIIALMIDRLKQCKCVDEIIIATSTNLQDDVLCQIAQREHVKCFKGNESDVLERLYMAAQHYKIDYIINVTGDCPLVGYDFIEDMIKEYRKTDADLIKTIDLPHGFYFYGIKVEALKKVLEIKDEMDTEIWGDYFTETGLFKVVNMKTPQELIRKNYRLTLDYHEDYEFFQALFKALGTDTYKKSTAEIIEFLDAHPEIVKINEHCEEIYTKRFYFQKKIVKLKTKKRVSTMKIGIVGLGSIGQRHARSLLKQGNIDIYALRTKKGTLTQLPDDLRSIKEIFDQDEFFAFDLDGIIISNPTSFHIKTMKKALEKKIPIFVEKPLANSLSEIKELEGYDFSKVLVGFNLRYDELINTVKNFLDSGKLGKIYKAHLYCGQYLPLWHPYADYRNEYYARKDLGGGVLRTLSHEIDIMHFLFGVPKELLGVVEKISSLDINVDDNAYLICRLKNNELITIEIDYLNPKGIREGTVFGSKGILQYTYTTPQVTFTDNTGSTTTLYKKEKIDWDTIYQQEMRDFIECITSGKKPKSTFNDGVEVMKIIEKAEQSTQSKSWQKI